MEPANVPLPSSSDSSEDSGDSEDSESEEEIPIKQEPERSISPKNPPIEEPKNNDIQSDEDVEMGDNQSSPRESRSPVVFHSNAPSGDERKSHAKINQTTGSISSSEEESSDEQESEDDTAENENDAKVKTEIPETQESSEDEDESDNDDEDVEMPDAPAHQSSPKLPSHARKNMVSPIKITNQRKSSSSDGDNTQDEVDLQLTSDVFEAQGPFSSPAKRPSAKPSFSFGASLSSLNSQKETMFKPKPSTNGQLAKSKLPQLLKKEFSESEEEEDSDSDDSDSSDDDDIPVPPTSQIIPPSTQTNGLAAAAKKIKDAASDSDSDSDSDNGSDDAMEAARKALMAEVYQHGMSASQNTIPQGSQISVNGGVGKGKGGNGVLGKANGNAKKSRTAGKEFAKKGKDRITNGYDFKSYGSFN